jgi:hypothetical protein
MTPIEPWPEIESELVERGYRRYENSPISNADYFYQKQFKDERGTKYFINMMFYVWPELGTRYCMEIINNEPHMEFSVHAQRTVDEYEALAEKFWSTMGCGYYDLEGE